MLQACFGDTPPPVDIDVNHSTLKEPEVLVVKPQVRSEITPAKVVVKAGETVLNPIPDKNRGPDFYEYPISPDQPDGYLTITVEITTTSGEVITETRQIVVDFRLPEIKEVTFNPPRAASNVPLTITLTASEPLYPVPEVTVAGKKAFLLDEPLKAPARSDPPSSLAFSFRYTLPPGERPANDELEVVISGTDVANNPTKRTTILQTDFDAPDTSLTKTPPAVTRDTTAVFQFTCVEGEQGSAPSGPLPCTFRCQIDSRPSTTCTSPLTIPELKEVSHVFRVLAADQAGNEDPSPSAFEWQIDLQPPTVAIRTGPGNMTNSPTPGFEFTSDDRTATFESSIDGGAWSSSGASYKAPALKDGPHTLKVRAVDSAGNVTAAEPASWRWTQDTVPPDTALISTPPATSKDPNATFNFVTTETGSTFRCQMDGNSPSECPATAVYAALSGGPHQFTVSAVDPAGNPDPTPASWTFTVVAKNPPAPNLLAITLQMNPPGNEDQIQGSAGAVDGGATVKVYADSALTSPLAQSVAAANGSFGPLAVGDNSGDADGKIHLMQVDKYGRSSAASSIQNDRLPPDTSINTAPPQLSNSTAAAFTFGCSEPPCMFRCKLDGGAMSTCSTPANYSGLNEGGHVLSVAAVDTAGNSDLSAATHTWTVDTTPPDTSITANPPTVSSSAAATFSMTSSDAAATLECQMDGGGFTTCPSPKNYPGLAEGTHTIQVRAVDAAGNKDPTPAGYTWQIDLTPPDTALNATPANPSKLTSASFGFTSNETGGTFECKLDTGSYTPCTSPHGYTSLTEGLHTFSVRAKDSVGGVDPSPAAFTWTVDTQPPSTPSNLAATVYSTTQINLVWSDNSGDETGFIVQRKPVTGFFADVASLSPGATSFSNTGLTNSSTYTYRVQAIDAAGNTSNSNEATASTPATDVAPSFTGLSDLVGISDSAVRLFWNPGSDDVTTQENLVYDICVSTAAGACAAAFTVAYSSMAGATSHTISGLPAGSTRYFVVRARDVAGNLDSNTVQKKRSYSSGYTSVAAGSGHACALASDGTVKCWGSNTYGQLGDGSTTSYSVPVSVVGISTATSIAAGDDYTCARLTGGTVRCWGYNASGQLGNGTSTNSATPVLVSGISTALSVAAGSRHTCAVLTDATLRCWGANWYGQFGDGTTTSSTTPIAVSSISTALSVAAGIGHTCAVLTDATLRCWGNNWSGQLGDGTTSNRLTPTAVSAMTTATGVAAGSDHTCARLSDGTARCWGYNGSGQLGNGTWTTSFTPVPVSGLSSASSLTAGQSYSCARLSDGTGKCWGTNQSGQLGTGSVISSNLPVDINGLSAATVISAGRSSGDTHTCSAHSDGTVRCWGYGALGQLGNRAHLQTSLPLPVSGIYAASAVSVGYSHVCTVLTDGKTRCWGANAFGQLGNGTTTAAASPVPVTGITTAAAVSAGGSHTCARLSDGTVQCWGYNWSGQLGNGTYVTAASPLPVAGLTTAADVAAGGAHACAALTNGTVQCWGYNYYGQLGDGTTVQSPLPVTVAGIANAIAVTAGANHTCAAISDGTAKCWGDNQSGRLGDGTTTNSSTPVPVSSLSGAVSVTAGDYHTCARISDGTLRCWGANGNGQLGNGTTTDSSTPVTVAVVTSATTVDVGTGHTCARSTGGTVRCWGANDKGQLGNGSLTSSMIPLTIPVFATATTLAAGNSETCSVMQDKTVRCSGNNTGGQRGIGYSDYFLVPTPLLGPEL